MPLSAKSLELIERIRELTGRFELVFPVRPQFSHHSLLKRSDRVRALCWTCTERLLYECRGDHIVTMASREINICQLT